MNFEMEKAKALAGQIQALITYVDKCRLGPNSFYSKSDKWYQIKLWIEEYKFRIIAEELIRINQFTWDEKYTHYLVKQFQKGMEIIEEYAQYNYDDLFLLHARLYTLNNLRILVQSNSCSLSREEIL